MATEELCGAWDKSQLTTSLTKEESDWGSKCETNLHSATGLEEVSTTDVISEAPQKELLDFFKNKWMGKEDHALYVSSPVSPPLSSPLLLFSSPLVSSSPPLPLSPLLPPLPPSLSPSSSSPFLFPSFLPSLPPHLPTYPSTYFLPCFLPSFQVSESQSAVAYDHGMWYWDGRQEWGNRWYRILEPHCSTHSALSPRMAARQEPLRLPAQWEMVAGCELSWRGSSFVGSCFSFDTENKLLAFAGPKNTVPVFKTQNCCKWVDPSFHASPAVYLPIICVVQGRTFPVATTDTSLFISKINFYVYRYFAWVCICVPPVCLVPEEARWQHQIHWRDYRLLWATIRVLGIEPNILWKSNQCS